jgi:hypothetical protein
MHIGRNSVNKFTKHLIDTSCAYREEDFPTPSISLSESNFSTRSCVHTKEDQSQS